MIPPDTYFIIKLWVNKELKLFGPYCELSYAMIILVDHIPVIARKISTTNAFNYKAEIHECILSENLLWTTISIPITENKCRRKKPKEMK